METFLGIEYNIWWFLVLGGVFTGYAILDGFDLGAGALCHGIFGILRTVYAFSGTLNFTGNFHRISKQRTDALVAKNVGHNLQRRKYWPVVSVGFSSW